MKFDLIGEDYTLNDDIKCLLVVIDDDRYGGCYSGAAYTAWRGGKPDDIDAGDGTCEDFWRQYRGCLHGGGNTPQAAFLDLKKKVEEQGWLFEEVLQCVLTPTGALVVGSPDYKEWLK